jgi:hypothetical protein
MLVSAATHRVGGQHARCGVVLAHPSQDTGSAAPPNCHPHSIPRSPATPYSYDTQILVLIAPHFTRPDRTTAISHPLVSSLTRQVSSILVSRPDFLQRRRPPNGAYSRAVRLYHLRPLGSSNALIRAHPVSGLFLGRAYVIQHLQVRRSRAVAR